FGKLRKVDADLADHLGGEVAVKDALESRVNVAPQIRSTEVGPDLGFFQGGQHRLRLSRSPAWRGHWCGLRLRLRLHLGDGLGFRLRRARRGRVRALVRHHTPALDERHEMPRDLEALPAGNLVRGPPEGESEVCLGLEPHAVTARIDGAAGPDAMWAFRSALISLTSVMRVSRSSAFS